MGRYILKTAKNKYKKEFSCVENWHGESGDVFSIEIVGNNLKDIYISYDVYNDLMIFIENHKSLRYQPFDLLKLLILTEMYDIPKKVAEKFISKVTAIRQKSN